MTHPDFEAQVDLYLDGELAPSDARELEVHLVQCAECTRFRDKRLALRAAIKSQIPALRAPEALRRRIQTQRRSGARFRAVVVWRSLALAASVAVVAFGGWQLGVQRGRGEMLASEVLTSHIRSLMPGGGHLTDVQSSDQHTVKPWFNGNLDYSPRCTISPAAGIRCSAAGSITSVGDLSRRSSMAGASTSSTWCCGRGIAIRARALLQRKRGRGTTSCVG